MLRLFFCYLVVTFAFCEQHTVYAGPENYKIVEKTLPPTFWHWKADDRLARDWMEEQIKAGRLPIIKMGPMAAGIPLLLARVPDFRDRKALYVWTNPAGGMGTFETEIYGNIPIKIDTKKQKFRVLELRSDLLPEDNQGYFFIKNSKETLRLAGIDVVHHVGYYGADVLLEEYVILNTAIVEKFTANPDEIRPILKPYYERFKKGGKFRESELHFKYKKPGRDFYQNEVMLEKVVKPNLDAYLNTAIEEKIPESWRNPAEFAAKYGDCANTAAVGVLVEP